MNPTGQLDIFYSRPPEEPSRNFIIYRSSAGSGKTFTLVKEYLKIVLRNPDDYRHILAVTFTNKATDEMKSRIVAYLDQLARGEVFDMRREIEKDFESEKIDLVMEKRARRALDNILHDYSRFEVSTIDHFFARLVRILARELQLPARFDLDVDNEKAIEEALERLYAQLNTDQELLVWMEQFALNKLEGNKGWKIDYNIKELGKELFKEKFHEGFADKKIAINDLKGFVSELNKTRRGFVETMREHAIKGNNFLNEHQVTPGDFKRYTASYFDRVLSGQYNITQTFEGAAKGQERWYVQKALNKDKIDQLLAEGLQDIASNLQEYHSTMYRGYTSSIELLKNIYSYGLLDLLYRQLRQYRTDNNLMLLSDTNFILRNVIQDQDTPFLFEKLGGRFNHILIDEFQDTSNYQWKNILPLVFHSISSNFRGVVVGDIKQSIYRWRGGNFNLLLNGVQKDLKQYVEQIAVKSLKKNWRSSRNIVHFNNAFFSIAQAILQSNPEIPPGSTIIRDAYKDLAQLPNRETDGYVEIRFFEPEINDYGKPINGSTAPQQYTLEVIHRVVKLGYTYGDIMILVDRWDLAGVISQHLNGADIPIVTENSLLLETSDLIRFLLNTLTWLVNPQDRTAETNMLYLYTVVTQKELADYHPLFQGNGNSGTALLPSAFLENLSRIRIKPVYDLVEELIIVFGLSGQADIYLQRFQDVCLEQSARGNQGIADFLVWWEEARSRRDKKKDLSVKLPPQTDAISIKTVHQAKGLEAPIVIMPFANFELKPKARSTFWTENLTAQFQDFKLLPLDFSNNLLASHFKEAYREELVEELLERLNVAYVAFTRARDQLYLMANQFNTKRYKLEDTTLNKIIFGVLDNPGFEFHQNWEPTQGIWKLGSPQAKEPQDEGPTYVSKELEIFSSTDYSQKVTIRPDSKKFFMLFDQEKSAKIREGLKIHAILERLVREEDLDQALQQCRNLGLIDREEISPLGDKIKTLLEDPTLKDWFGPGWSVLNERSIMDQGKVYRPDRVMLRKDLAVIVDYKREKRQSRHQTQLNHYGDLLGKMGFKTVKKYAVYISDFSIVEIE